MDHLYHRMGLSAVLAAVCTFSVAVFAEDVTVALILRFATGVCLAGVYPVGMKLMASWASAAERGAAMGLLIGALTLGSTLPHLISGFAVLPWRTVLNITAAVEIGRASCRERGYMKGDGAGVGRK